MRASELNFPPEVYAKINPKIRALLEADIGDWDGPSQEELARGKSFVMSFKIEFEELEALGPEGRERLGMGLEKMYQDDLARRQQGGNPEGSEA